MLRCDYIVPYLNAYGGIQQFAQAQVGHLVNDVDIGLYDWRPGYLLRLGGAVKDSRLGSRIWSGVARYEALSGRSDADVTHFWHILPAIAQGRRCKPYVVTCHGAEMLPQAIGRYGVCYAAETLRAASAIVVNSDYVRQLVLTTYGVPSGLVHRIYPGIDLEKFKPALSRHRMDDCIRIGTLCRLESRKNLLTTIQAVTLLQERMSAAVEYVLAGDGSQKGEVLGALARSGLKWRYLGGIEDEEKISEFYPSLDAFVLVPRSTDRDIEGFGIVYLEANASGVPVVASRTGGVESAVRTGLSGFFADYENPASICDAICRVLERGDEMRVSAARWAESFDSEKGALSLKSLYSQLAMEFHG